MLTRFLTFFVFTNSNVAQYNKLDSYDLPVRDRQYPEPTEATNSKELPPWFFDDVLYLTEMLVKPIEEVRREAQNFNPAIFTIHIKYCPFIEEAGD